jgi:hypothetical protein
MLFLKVGLLSQNIFPISFSFEPQDFAYDFIFFSCFVSSLAYNPPVSTIGRQQRQLICSSPFV